MGFWGSLGKAYHASQQVESATTAALQVLADGRGPLAALDAFTAETGTNLDDKAAAEIRAGLTQAIEVCTYISVGAAAVADALADPRLAKELDKLVGQAIDAGLWAGSWKATMKAWMAE